MFSPCAQDCTVHFPVKQQSISGIGYGHGSTRSRWDIERTVEERLAREEHLIWLVTAFTAYIGSADAVRDLGMMPERLP